MINIRRGTFETNSSSTHSICITKEDTFVRVPEELKVNIGCVYPKIQDVEMDVRGRDLGTGLPRTLTISFCLSISS